MRPQLLHLVRLIALVFLIGVLAGCGSYQAPNLTVAVTPAAAAVASGQTTQFSAAITGDSSGVTWKATAGTIDANGLYTAPTDSQSSTQTITATSKKDMTKAASAIVHVVVPGQVTPTANLQVAQYSISPAGQGKVSVQFGLDTNYGLTTWQQPIPQGGGTVSLFVAGMKASSLYHMRGIVEFDDNAQFADADQTFTTGDIPAAQLPALTVTTTTGLTPQSGVELLDLIGGTTQLTLAVSDLAGNMLWGYDSALPGIFANPIKLLPNGHFLMNFSGVSPDGMNSVLREVDLAGTTIWEMKAADLNNALATATCAGCNIKVIGTHHDFAVLPNGHLIVIAGQIQTISGTAITGDVLIDLDQNHKPVWLWNEFDFLDTNRRPMGFPDWTHTNAVIYSPDDGNLIISIRHQNWLVKVPYTNGNGSGPPIWKLGYQGDFSLIGGSDPIDWFYAQHGPSFTTTNTTGNFSLILFDNGNDRGFPTPCGTTGQPACYSTVPLLQLDEMAKTATLKFHPKAPTFSFFGGNAAVLKNGNVEFCESAGGPGTAGDIYEVTQDSSATIVWKMLITGQFAYRGQRIPSLYPGVQW